MKLGKLATAVACFLFLGVDAREASPSEFAGPSDLAVSADGKTIFVALEGASAVAVVDVAAGKLARTLPVPGVPGGLCVLGDGVEVAVACGGLNGQVVVLDAASGALKKAVKVGHTPRAPRVAPDGKTLYVCNQFDGTVSVVDMAEFKERQRIAVLREPNAAAISPDGSILAVANLLPEVSAYVGEVAAAVSLIETASGAVANVRLPSGSSSVRGVCVSPDGKLALATHVLGRFVLPTSQVERGWMNTNALSVIDLGSKSLLGSVLLDEIDRGASNPWGVSTSADGKWWFVSHAGTHEISRIDAPALLQKLAEKGRPAGDGYSSTAGAASDLAFIVGLRRRIDLNGNPSRGPAGGGETQNRRLDGPRGVAIAGDSVYAACYFSGEMARVPTEGGGGDGAEVDRIALSEGPGELSIERQGERAFHDATLSFQGWQSCASCHPDGRADGLNWDLLNDGLGNPNNVKSLLLAHQTPPAMISGVRADARTAVRTGFRFILFAQPGEEVTQAVDAYLEGMRSEPSPALVDGKLTESAERGRALFEGDRLRCASCHPGPLFTDMKMHDVASRGPTDQRDTFDTPTLVESWRTAPYLHDGRFATLEALLREGKHGSGRGDVAGLSDAELGDLVAYLKSL